MDQTLQALAGILSRLVDKRLPMMYSTAHGGRMSSHEKIDTALLIVSFITVVGIVIYLLAGGA